MPAADGRSKAPIAPAPKAAPKPKVGGNRTFRLTPTPHHGNGGGDIGSSGGDYGLHQASTFQQQDRVKRALAVIAATPATHRQPKMGPKPFGSGYHPPRYFDFLVHKGKDGALHYPKGSGPFLETQTRINFDRLMSKNRSPAERSTALDNLQASGHMPDDKTIHQLTEPGLILPKLHIDKLQHVDSKPFYAKAQDWLAHEAGVVGKDAIGGAAKLIGKSTSGSDLSSREMQSLGASPTLPESVRTALQKGVLAGGSAVSNALDRPLAATESGLGKTLVDIGAIKGQTAEQIRHARGPIQALLHGRNWSKDVTGATLAQGLGLPKQLGLAPDLGLDPLMYAGLALAPETGGASLAPVLAKIRRVAPEILHSEEAQKAFTAYHEHQDPQKLASDLAKLIPHDHVTAVHAQDSTNIIKDALARKAAGGAPVASKEAIDAVTHALRVAEERRVRPAVKLQGMLPTGRRIGKGVTIVPEAIGRHIPVRPLLKGERAAKLQTAERQAQTRLDEELRSNVAELDAQIAAAQRQRNHARVQQLEGQKDQLTTAYRLKTMDVRNAARQEAGNAFQRSVRTLGDVVDARNVKQATHWAKITADEYGRTVQARFSKEFQEASRELPGSPADKARSLKRIQLHLIAEADTKGAGIKDLQHAITLTPAEAHVAENFRQVYRDMLAHGQETGVLEHGIADYVGHRIWQRLDNPEDLAAEVKAITKSSTTGFQRHRIHQAVSDYADPFAYAHAIREFADHPISEDEALNIANRLWGKGNHRAMTELTVRRLQRGEEVPWEHLTPMEKEAVDRSSRMSMAENEHIQPLFATPLTHGETTEGLVLPHNFEGHGFAHPEQVANLPENERALVKLHSLVEDRQRIHSMIESMPHDRPEELAQLHHIEERLTEAIDQLPHEVRLPEHAQELTDLNKALKARTAETEAQLKALGEKPTSVEQAVEQAKPTWKKDHENWHYGSDITVRPGTGGWAIWHNDEEVGQARGLLQAKKEAEKLAENGPPAAVDEALMSKPLHELTPAELIQRDTANYAAGKPIEDRYVVKEVQTKNGKPRWVMFDRRNNEVVSTHVTEKGATEKAMEWNLTDRSTRTQIADGKVNGTIAKRLGHGDPVAQAPAATPNLAALKGQWTRTRNKILESEAKDLKATRERIIQLEQGSKELPAMPGHFIKAYDHNGDLWISGPGSHVNPPREIFPRSTMEAGPYDNPFDTRRWLGELPDLRASDRSMVELDPRISGHVRARAQGLTSAFQARWKAIDAVHGRSAKEYWDRVYTIKGTGEHGFARDLHAIRDTDGHVVYYVDKQTGVEHEVSDLHFPEPTLIPNSRGDIWLDTNANAEYMFARKQLDSILQVNQIPEDRLWPAQVLDALTQEMKGAGEYDQIYKTGMETGYQRFMSLVRFGVTTPFPAYHVRNMMSDMIKSLQADSGVLFHPIVNAKMMAAAYNKGLSWSVHMPGYGKMKLDDLLFVADMFGVRSGHHVAEVAQLMRDGDFTTSRLKDFHQRFNPFHAGGWTTKFGAHREDVVRLQTFMQRLRANGGDAADAAWYMTRHHFNFNDLSQTEKRTIRNLFLFYTWYRKNIPLQLTEIVRRPGFFAGMQHVYGETAAGGAPWNYGPFQGPAPAQPALPSYVHDKLSSITTNWNGYALNVGFGAPWSDLQFASWSGIKGDAFGQLVSPVYQLPVELIFRKDPLTGRTFKERENSGYADIFKALGADLPKDENGQATLPWWENLLLRQVPLTGRASYGFQSVSGTRDQGRLQKYGQLLAPITGLNIYVSPKVGSPRERAAIMKQILGRAAERKNLLENLSNFASPTSGKPSAYYIQRVKDFDAETLKMAKQNGWTKYLKDAKNSGFYQGPGRSSRKSGVTLGTGSGGGVKLGGSSGGGVSLK